MPETVFERASRFPGIAFLDGRARVARAPLSHVAWRPARSLRVYADERVTVGDAARRGNPLEALDAFLAEESGAGRTVIAALAYDLRCWIEPTAGGLPQGDLPVVAAFSYRECHTYDHRRHAWKAPPPILDAHRFGGMLAFQPRPNLDPESYRALFDRVRDWIAAGDVYQVNLSTLFEAKFDGDPAALYERLARSSPMPYGAYIDFGDFQLLSNSPELFLERRGETIATRPIKGTRPRGRTAAEDARLIEELLADPKERAEHVMIVDLERNDLGRVADVGSVLVSEYGGVESYATLHHLESTVSAKATRGLPLSAFLRALFPGGSITGAPKIRAMQILDRLEPSSRGFYTGGILHYPPDGDFTMSICIRTATIRDGCVRFAAGGGLVADSDPAAEYEECLLKAAAFLGVAHGEASE